MTCKSQLNAVLIGQCDMDPASTFNCMWIIVSWHTESKIYVTEVGLYDKYTTSSVKT